MIWFINPITLLLMYIAYAWLYEARKDNKWLNIFYWPVFIIGALLDAVVNITWFTVIFFERPREWLLTKRVERLKDGDGYRGWLARLLCKLMNIFQAGHCK